MLSLFPIRSVALLGLLLLLVSRLASAVTVPPRAVAASPFQAQAEIEKALAEALRLHRPDRLLELTPLVQRTSAPYTRYWLSYLSLYQSIYYLQVADRVRAETAIKVGLDIFRQTPPQRSEEYALLAYLQGFAIQFRYGMAAAMASAQLKENAAQALRLDPANLRAYYVLGSTDYYTPARYGGGKLAEGYLRKALTLPDQATPNAQAPSWGREQTYELLIKLYLSQNKLDLARKYYVSAQRLFPASYILPELNRSLAKAVASRP